MDSNVSREETPPNNSVSGAPSAQPAAPTWDPLKAAHDGALAAPVGTNADASQPVVPASRARLPLEHERDLGDGEAKLHEVSLQVETSLARLSASLGIPPLAIATAAWIALCTRIRSSEMEADIDVLLPGDGALSGATLAAQADETRPFSELAENVVQALEEGSLNLAKSAAFVIDGRSLGGRGDAGPGVIARLVMTDVAPLLELDATRFVPDTARSLADSFAALVEHAANAPTTPLRQLAILSEAERERLLRRLDATSMEIAPTCFHYLFEDQAQRTPNRPALAFKGQMLSYAVLNARANRLARFLVDAGASGRCVALLVERSAEMIIGLLGILKAGSAYVPLLPDVPPARLAHQLREAAAPIVLSQSKLASIVPEDAGVRVVSLDGDWHAIERFDDTDPERSTKPEDIAYVIYTSGSTGNPKGVAVRHDNLVNYTGFLATKLGLKIGRDGEALSFATVSTLAADLGNTSIFPCLASGGCLHVIDHATSLDGHAFAAYAENFPIDVLKITPSHLAALMAFEGGERALPRRFLVTGGEASTWPLRERVREKQGLTWFNHYGPTETTIGSLTYDIDEFDRHWSPTIPIGRPIANTRTYVLDEQRRLLPEGVVGELHIGGRGVTAGYLNQPDMTAERFLADPFSSEPGARMYRTGDRVRLLPSGAIEFLGRVDHQVKIRGYRIELGEIEAALRRHPDVRQTIVVAREDRPGDLRIVAYVVGARPQVDTSVLRAALAAELPPFMLPSAFVVLDVLPLTANGKVDRKKLPAPSDGDPEPQAAAPAPSSDEVEEQIATIWKDVLGIKRIGRTDEFFRIGGDSLKALYVLARIERDIGRRLTHGDFLMEPTVKGLAAALRREARGRSFASIVPLQTKGTKPPLFCIHGGGGHVYYYRDLARRLGLDQPFYGLQGRHADGRLSRQTRVEDMAEYYLEEIKEIAPEGPYYLSGASFGGKVAFEMAQILHRRGERAALVAMFDTWGPGYPNYRVPKSVQAAGWLYRRVEHHLGSVLMLDADQRGPYLREKAIKTRDEIRDILNLNVSRLARKNPFRSERGGADAGSVGGAPNGKSNGSMPEVDEGFIAIASRAYRPSYYPGKVILFRSRQQPIGVAYDRTLGWGGLAADLEIHDVVGLHAAVVAEPRVKFLVDEFLPCLTAAQAEHHGE
ncbi:MAG: amino acid adenylation domain-containing protein [Polyangiaceae bacterium]|nr:amino acid adenylation domain-containing protein [Polyangiaceae bacterium]